MSGASVRQLAREIVGREGGFVDHPHDPGGATNHGVTLGTLQRLGLDLDGSGRIDAEDVRRLTIDDAVEIFVTHYHHRPGIWRLPAALQPTVFDMQVNAGGNAGRLLQRVLNDAGFGPLVVDGVIGPGTAAAAGRADAAMGALLVDAYGIARRDYYYAIADRRPRLRTFALRRDGGKGGWIRRAEEFISAPFHLSTTEHQRRISAWV